jgi:hypothetical protein
MKNLSLICLSVCLASCGGGEFSNGEVTPSSDANLNDASNDASNDAMTDGISQLDTQVDDIVTVPDVNEEPIVTNDASCNPGDLFCNDKTPMFCNKDGVLQSNPTCAYLCVNGMCTGECSPGTQQCNGKFVQTCNSNGQWVTTQTCASDCKNNSCPTIWCCGDMTYPDIFCTCHPMAACSGTLLNPNCNVTYSCCFLYGLSLEGDNKSCDCINEPDCDNYLINHFAVNSTAYVRQDSCP